MKAKIEKLGRQANGAERKLLRAVWDLNKDMFEYECHCDGAVKYNFVNTHGHYKNHVLCLNCGGKITPNEMDERKRCDYPLSEFYDFEDEVPEGVRVSTPDDCIGCEEKESVDCLELCDHKHCLIEDGKK